MTRARAAVATLAIALAFSTAASASETTKFVITIKSVELKTNSGEWKTLISPDKQVDLIETEPTISLFNNGEIPPGNYINYRVTILETITFAGRDKHNYTKAGGRSILRGTASTASELPGEIAEIVESSPTWNTETVGDVAQQIDFDNADKDDFITITGKRDLTAPLEIKKGSFVKIWFDLDLEEVVSHVWPQAYGALPKNDIMVALLPARVEELVIMVDQREETFSPEGVVVEF